MKEISSSPAVSTAPPSHGSSEFAADSAVTYRSYAVLGCSPSSSRPREFGRRETSFDALSVALSGGARLRAAPPSRLR